jgi:cytidine deaminase
MNNTQLLFDAAKSASLNSYSPYSKFKVGCAIISTSGKIYSGCNVENISYPVGTCAEQSAISAMINAHDYQISEILIFADSSNLITPCGACRQRINEFASADTIVHLANAQGIQKTIHFFDIFPLSFKEL